MADKITNTRLVCEGGLDTTENHLNLSLNKPGSATNLINYEVGLTGGYRRVSGYQVYDETYQEVGVGVAEGPILGIIIYKNLVTGTATIIAARKTLSANEYELYEHQAGGWVQIVTGLTRLFTSSGEEVEKLRWAISSDGVKNYLAIVDGVNNAMLYDGSTWVEINAADTGADYAHAGGNQAIDAPTRVAFFENHLFVARDAINDLKGVVAHSAPDNFYDWLTANGAGQVIAGFDVEQIKPFRNELFVFGKSAIKKISIDNLDFVINDVTAELGCVAGDSVIELGGELIFLGPDGFRPISATDRIGDVELETISKPIQELIRSRLPSIDTVFNVNTVVIKSKSQFRLTFSTDLLEVNDSKGIIGALRGSDQQFGWEFGELRGFRITCATSDFIDGVEVILHGDYDGKVYQQERGNDLNGSPMLSVYSTPYLDFGDTEFRKVIKAIRIFIRGEGDVILNLGLSFDWGDTDNLNPISYPMTVDNVLVTYGGGAKYGDGSVYGGILKPIIYQNVEGSFLSVRFTFSAFGSEYPHSIHGMVIRHTVEGQR